jgi:selenide,water dikinase
VDDAFTFGRIAAANALSDVFAMGGKPLLAVAILGWPIEKLGAELAQRVVEGGRTACHEAGIPLAGGHSIDAPEPFFGLAVTGTVPMANIKRNNTATPGLTLLLTKPIGTGILSTAMKRGKLKADDEETLVRQLCAMNSAGTLLGGIAGVKAMTDVTGFGLMGHLLELCDGSGVNARLWFDRIPLLSSVNTYLTEGCYPDGAFRNWKAYNDRCTGANDMTRMMVLSDPQTNGGLLIAVEPDSVEHAQDVIRSRTGGPAAMIGETLPPGNAKPVEVV